MGMPDPITCLLRNLYAGNHRPTGAAAVVGHSAEATPQGRCSLSRSWSSSLYTAGPSRVCAQRLERSRRRSRGQTSMPRPQLRSVFHWNICCIFMAILSARADFCQAQQGVSADK